MSRKNKTKPEIVSDMQLANDAIRRRALVKDIIFPYLVNLDESISYSKVFLQAYSGLIEGVYEENRKKTTVGHLHDRIIEKLGNTFTTSDPEGKREYDRYVAMTEQLKDISVQDLSYATELPRFIDGYMMKDSGKAKIKTIPIDELLGK